MGEKEGDVMLTWTWNRVTRGVPFGFSGAGVLVWGSMQGSGANERTARGVGGLNLGGGEDEVMGCGPQ
ncbi:hypothetical protein VNO80_02490 [Phaseolus coccineus]|uniref:Uncharacterized protein n=1 Tax=Phaseolus coccineus TaxID=3886 RepID=A0AAN9NPS9_PHACN